MNELDSPFSPPEEEPHLSPPDEEPHLSPIDEEPHLSPVEPATAPVPVRPSRRMLALLLTALSLVGSLAVLPFSYDLFKKGALPNLPPGGLPLLLGIGVVVEMVLSVVAIGLGVWLGPRLGLIPPLLHPGPMEAPSAAAGLEVDAPASRSGWRWRAVCLALATGASLGLVIGEAGRLADPLMPEPPQPLGHAKPLVGLLASIGAGIREEVWMRLGVLTVVASIVVSLSRTKQLGPVAFWAGNLAAALVFAAIHIPQVLILIGMNAVVLGFVVFGNGIPGLVFGWLYRRNGLVAAMLSHFMLDVMLKVAMPALGLD